jgi:hypothetical protein
MPGESFAPSGEATKRATPRPFAVEGYLSLSRVTGLPYPVYQLWVDFDKLDHLLRVHLGPACGPELTQGLGHVRLTIAWREATDAGLDA